MKIDKDNKMLLDVWTMCAGEPNASHEIKQWKIEGNLDIHSAKCQVSKGTKFILNLRSVQFSNS